MNIESLLIYFIGGGLLTFLGGVIALFFNRRKTASEATKLDAETEQTKATTLLELQKGLLDVQRELEDVRTKNEQALDAMRKKNEELYASREKERDAKRAEMDRILADMGLVKQLLATETAMNFGLTEQIRVSGQASFEKQLAAQALIDHLQRRLDEHDRELVIIKKDTGDLRDRMPSHKEER
jgi:hypothetical protein